jgi:hypothetical protein
VDGYLVPDSSAGIADPGVEVEWLLAEIDELEVAITSDYS